MARPDYKSLRWVQSKDGKTQARIVLNDELHELTWGRLLVASQPRPMVPVVEVADPEAWIRAERAKPSSPAPAPQNPFADRYFDRTDWFSTACDIASVQAPAVRRAA